MAELSSKREMPVSSTSPERARSGRKAIWVPVALVALLLGGVSYWQSTSAAQGGEAAEEEPAVVVSVELAQANKQDLSETATALGTLFAQQQAVVSSKVSGQIRAMAQLRNKTVRAGETLATFESIEFSGQLAQAEKDLHAAAAARGAAKNLVERRKALLQAGGISQKETEASELDFDTADENLRFAERTVELLRGSAKTSAKMPDQATIRAPFSGVVTEQFAYEGEYVTPGTKLVSVADLNQIIVKAAFADLVVAQLHEGDEVDVVTLDQPDRQLVGVISLLSRVADPAARTVEVWVSLPNKDGSLRPGTAARLTVHTKTVRDAIVVPLSAVTLSASTQRTGTVMLVDAESVAHEHEVTLGVRSTDGYQVLEGLTGGETVVVEGNYALPDKTKVKAASEEKDDGKEEGDKEAAGKEEGGKEAAGKEPADKEPTQAVEKAPEP